MRNLLMLLSAVLTASLFLGAAGCDSSEPAAEEILLDNQADSLVGFSVVDESFFLTRPEPVEFDTTNLSEDSFIQLLSVGDTRKLDSCSGDSPLADQKVILWEVEFTDDGDRGLALRKGEISNKELRERFRRKDCRIIIDSLS